MRYIFCFNLRQCSLKVPKWWILSYHEQMTIIEVVIHRSFLNIFLIIELLSCSIRLSIERDKLNIQNCSLLHILMIGFFKNEYGNTIYIRQVGFSFLYVSIINMCNEMIFISAKMFVIQQQHMCTTHVRNTHRPCI